MYCVCWKLYDIDKRRELDSAYTGRVHLAKYCGVIFDKFWRAKPSWQQQRVNEPLSLSIIYVKRPPKIEVRRKSLEGWKDGRAQRYQAYLGNFSQEKYQTQADC